MFQDVHQLCEIVREAPLPESFLQMRDLARQNRDQPVDSDADSIDTTNNEDGTNRSQPSQHDDGLLIPDVVISQLIESSLATLTDKVSSEMVDEAAEQVIDECHSFKEAIERKKIDECEALRSAFENAVRQGSASPSLLDKLPRQPELVEPSSPPESTRDPRDRRKRLRCSHFRYVTQPSVPNSVKALHSALKIINDGNAIGFSLSKVFSTMEDHLDAPLKDHISGVSTINQSLTNS